MNDNPKRAVCLTVKIEADTRQAMADALSSLSYLVATGRLTTGVSGGYDSGWIYEYTEGASPSHDAYFEQVRVYLDNLAQGGA